MCFFLQWKYMNDNWGQSNAQLITTIGLYFEIVSFSPITFAQPVQDRVLVRQQMLIAKLTKQKKNPKSIFYNNII